MPTSDKTGPTRRLRLASIYAEGGTPPSISNPLYAALESLCMALVCDQCFLPFSLRHSRLQSLRRSSSSPLLVAHCRNPVFGVT